MKFSKEARIGLLVASAILVFFAGFYFLKGANIFSGENEYYTYYENVQGLHPSSAVQIKGLTVGRVSAIDLNGKGKVKVTLAIDKDTKIPEGTIAKLTATDLLGTKAIALDLGSGTQLIEDESTLPSDIEGGIIDALSEEITPLLVDMRHAVGTLDTVLTSINTVLDRKAQADLRQSIGNLNTTMGHLAQLSQRLNAESGQLASVMRNANSITTNLANNNDRINRILDNTATASDKLAQVPIEEIMRDLQLTANQLNGIAAKINSSQGSLGLLVNDTSLYRNLNTSLHTLNYLMADIEAHPARYINFSIFGRRK